MNPRLSLVLALLLVGCATHPTGPQFVSEEKAKPVVPPHPAYPIRGATTDNPSDILKLLATSLDLCVNYGDELRVLLGEKAQFNDSKQNPPPAHRR